jgi:Carboxypeptidase regulatory-like domain/TonB dependent receptor-like, beta-barrel/TonB-dependent Receptor Plug Domain
MKIARMISCLTFLCICMAVQVSAQVNNASLTGLVTDSAGAVVPNASVIVKNKATDLQSTTTTDSSGYFTFASLPVGIYTIIIELPGFKKAVHENVNLEVGQKARIDTNLEVGTVTESVVVGSTPQLLTTQEATTGGVIENRLVNQLPLSGRNWDDLVALIPGVQADRYTEEGGGTANGRTGGANVHGVRSLQNNYVLDGVDNNSISENVQELTTQVARPSVDSIQEFKVSTNPYSAENGRSPGALISVTTKSGGNEFHGTLYEFHRNRVFDANNFFNNRAGARKPQNIQNQFGGNIGGPVTLPHFGEGGPATISGKNSVFFFFNYEGTRIRKGVTRLGNVPLANEIRGDFSAAAGTANRIPGGYAKIFDRVGDCRMKVPGAFNGDGSFINNQIPSQCLDPLAQKILSLTPGPNVIPGSGALNVSNFLRNPGITDDTDSYTGRVDWAANSRNTFFVRYTNSDRFRYIPGIFGGIVDGTGSSANGRLFMKGQSAAIGWTRTLNERMVNEFRFGWGRNNSLATQDPFGLNTLAEIGFKGVQDSPIYSGGISGIVISARGGTTQPGGQSGFDRLGSPDFLPKSQRTNQFQWTDTVSISSGAHSIKIGGDVRGPMRNIYLDVPALRGSFNFDGNRTGIGLADFLLGYPSGAQLTNLAVVDQRMKMFSGFFQDDWKITQQLTLNLGVRYDYATWPYEGADRMTNFDPITGVKFTPANSPVGRSLVKPDKNNFAPRLGLAYQLNNETVVRAGYGRFFMLFERAGSEDQLALNLPFLVNNVVSAGSNNSSTANGMRLQTGFNLSLDPSAVTVTTVRLRAVNPEATDSSVDQWNLGVQRLLPGDMVATLDYVGTKGTHLSTLFSLNQPLLNANGTVTNAIINGTLQPVFPYPSLGPIEYRDNGGNSMYHGGEVTLEKRFSRGLSFRTAYTFSKSIDESQEHLAAGGTGSFTQNNRNLGERRGPSDFDVRHRFVASYIYELPFGKGRSYLNTGALSEILGGWRISGLSNIRSGRPFTIRAGANDTALGGTRSVGISAFADCLRDGSLSGSDRTIDRWFDSTAYAVPTALNPTTNTVQPRLGNCGRNTVRGPGITNFDFSVARTFSYFGEGRDLEIRWEVFNMFNTPQFGLPERNISSTAVGRITSLAGDPRVMQFALKFNF